MQAGRRIAVAGATGRVGRHVVDVLVDVATGPSPDQEAATEFFTTAARNLHEAGERTGVRRMVVVAIIGIDRFTAGYNAAKVAHERAMQSGPIPVRVLRAAQFQDYVLLGSSLSPRRTKPRYELRNTNSLLSTSPSRVRQCARPRRGLGLETFRPGAGRARVCAGPLTRTA